MLWNNGIRLKYKKMKKIQITEYTSEEFFADIKNAVISEIVEQLSSNFQPKIPEDYLTIEQVCELLKKDRVTIWRWTKSNKLNAYQIGGSPIYRRSEIDAQILANKINF